jgi:hypothetical protein
MNSTDTVTRENEEFIIITQCRLCCIRRADDEFLH